MAFTPFIPNFSINGERIDAAQIEFSINGKQFQGLTSLTLDEVYDSGDAYGTGGKITNFTRGIYRGGTGTATLYIEDYNEWYNTYALRDPIDFFRVKYKFTIAFIELLTETNALTINNVKVTGVGRSFTTDSEEPLVVPVSFKFTGIGNKGLLGDLANTVVDTVSSII